MRLRKLGETLGIALASAIIVILGMTLVSRFNESRAERDIASSNVQIIRAVQTSKLIVMQVEANVLGGSKKRDVVGNYSELWYFSKAGFDYSVNMKAIRDADFRYDQASDELKVRIPKIEVNSYLVGTKKRIAGLTLLATEGGAGNELEAVASKALEENAQKTAAGRDIVAAAVKAAKYEVGKLYEDAFRAAGRKTRVTIVTQGEPW